MGSKLASLTVSFFILSFVLPFLKITLVSAVATSGSLPMSGLTVSPAFSTAQVGSLQPQTNVSIGVKNNTNSSISIEAALKGLAVQGSRLIPDSKPEEVLSKIVSVTPNRTTIPAGDSVNISVAIKDDVALSPGGHYAAILISQVADESAGPISQLSIEPAISATVYIIKEDGAVRGLVADDLKPIGSLFLMPSSAFSTFENTGNVTAVPRGIVTIRKGSNIYAQGIINTDSFPVFRGSSTNFKTDLKPLKRAFLPGMYTANLEYRYDGQDISKTVSKSFLHIPIATILVILFIVVLIGLVYRGRNTILRKRSGKTSRVEHNKPKKFTESLPETRKIFDVKAPEYGAAKPATTAPKKRRVTIDD